MEHTFLTVADVEAIHEEVLKHSGGSAGIRDRGALESAVHRPQFGYYADLIEEAAALLESLTMNHPFVDGNKRTALASVETFLDYNDYTISAGSHEIFDFFMKNLKTNTFRFPVILEWLREVVISQKR